MLQKSAVPHHQKKKKGGAAAYTKQEAPPGGILGLNALVVLDHHAILDGSILVVFLHLHHVLPYVVRLRHTEKHTHHIHLFLYLICHVFLGP